MLPLQLWEHEERGYLSSVCCSSPSNFGVVREVASRCRRGWKLPDRLTPVESVLLGNSSTVRIVLFDAVARHQRYKRGCVATIEYQGFLHIGLKIAPI